MTILQYCKDLWARVLLQGVHYGDRHRQLNNMYRVRDPWGLDSERERYRFKATNAIILREFGKVGSLVEVGCGEGLQSEYLSTVCEKLCGIDVSSIAVARARERLPGASFLAGDITRENEIDMPPMADLAVACEVLYYVKDVQQFLNRLSAIGRSCIVTYYATHRARLDAEIARGRQISTELIQYEGTEWVAAWWRNTPPLTQDGSGPSHDRPS